MTIARRRRIDEVDWIKLFFAIMLTVIVVNVLVLLFVVLQQDASGSTSVTDNVTEFRLYGNHAEDTVSETLQAVGWNVTEFRPLQNQTILVAAVPISISTTVVGEENT